MAAAQAPSTPSGDLSVWQIKYGERVVRMSDVFHDFSQYRVPDGDLDMDYNFWLVRDSERTILVDTGYDIPQRDWLGEISVTPTPDGLALVGVDPAMVDMVITSHFHYDHIGYLKLFKNAIVVSGRAEYDYWFAKRDTDALDGEFTTAEDLAVIESAASQNRLQLVDSETEVTPGITVYPVGGHCPGELLTLIRSSPTESLLLTVDAAHFYEQVEHEWPFFAFTDLDEMRSGLAFIKTLARETGATVIPGHDARVRDRFPAAPGAAAEVATVLA